MSVGATVIQNQPPLLRPVRGDEQADALQVWLDVFGDGRAYFTRYFEHDPWYREGDCLGAWVDGRLVSVVHLCRRPLEWNGRTIWCGGIANVATLAAYRSRGLSRSLLRLSIESMQETGIAFSALGTGRPGHYAALGWEPAQTPRPAVLLADREGKSQFPRPILDPAALEPTARFAAIYSAPIRRPLQLERSDGYFRGWTAWGWKTGGYSAFLLDNLAYMMVLRSQDDPEALKVMEWRAPDAELEGRLLRGIAAVARNEGRTKLVLLGMPRWGGRQALEGLGEVLDTATHGRMLRNIALPDAEYQQIASLYASGEAVWWPADGF